MRSHWNIASSFFSRFLKENKWNHSRIELFAQNVFQKITFKTWTSCLKPRLIAALPVFVPSSCAGCWPQPAAHPSPACAALLRHTRSRARTHSHPLSERERGGSNTTEQLQAALYAHFGKDFTFLSWFYMIPRRLFLRSYARSGSWRRALGKTSKRYF